MTSIIFIGYMLHVNNGDSESLIIAIGDVVKINKSMVNVLSNTLFMRSTKIHQLFININIIFILIT